MAKSLVYVSDCELDDRFDEISEPQIGVHVFGRPASYNPADDNIVRTSARNLRQKLQEYFRAEGASEPIEVSIPVGAYRPVFRERLVSLTGATGGDVPDSSSPTIVTQEQAIWVRRHLLQATFVILSAWFVFSVLFMAVYHERIAEIWNSFRMTDNPLWKELFNRDHDTLVVYADSSLVTVENLTKKSVSLPDYLSQQYASNLPEGSLPKKLFKN